MKIKEFKFGNLILGIAQDIGPRVIKLAIDERPDANIFGVLPEAGVDTPDGFWPLYGGHRLWSSPEAMPRSYSMDNAPVRIEESNCGITVYGNTEAQNGIEKELEIISAGENKVEVLHRIRNIGRWPVTLACWAMSVMKPGGFAIAPVKAGGEGLLPDRRITLWPYTDLADKRLVMEKDFIFLKQDISAGNPIKIGTMAYPCWTAYCVDGLLFIKQFVQEEGEYPDFGCNVEIYANASMLELETLGALKELAPGCAAEHKEIWTIKKVSELSPCQSEMERAGIM